MKKIAIITITDNTNYGNRLQNYALENYLSNKGFEVNTIWDKDTVKRKIKYILYTIFGFYPKFRRFNNFKKFSKKFTNIKKIDYRAELLNDYDYIVVGSDQIWNLKWQMKKNLFIKDMPNKKMISYAPSFGVSNVEKEKIEEYSKIISNVKYLSVREDRGKEIINEITQREDVEVLIDPTMLLEIKEWNKIIKKPNNKIPKKYILLYFLGNISEKVQIEIEKIAAENNCEIINILDKNNKFFDSDPTEFLYLEKNAFLICTDSFHSSVFGFLFNRPFIIFDRNDNEERMNSRLDTLISKFKLKNRYFNGENIDLNNLNHDYTESYKILEEERKKSEDFIKRALDLKDEK